MEILNAYFETLVFYYAEEKKNLAVYVAVIAGMLGGDKVRCVIAFVPAHLGVVKKSWLRDLSWVNLQMRTCPKETYKTPPQKWKAPIDNIPLITLAVINRDKNYSQCVSTTQNVNFPLDVLMIHSPKKQTIYQYPNTMNLHWAIDQFNTVFSVRIDSPRVIDSSQTETSLNSLNDTQVSSGGSNTIEWL